ncbi:MAG: hypothetical protein HY920_00675, partial [Elusimicrobia bacterium]|nr:hypothetical protein [Elusimicrobiota bacterium]
TLERLVEVVKGHGHQSLDRLMTTIKDEVYGFISTQDQYDDITLVGMEAIQEGSYDE